MRSKTAEDVMAWWLDESKRTKEDEDQLTFFLDEDAA